ncbi:MAG: S41 family peptidase [Caldilineaceae bacterium]|nr:S41 family peptidase [Caldilineaceae bacterium]
MAVQELLPDGSSPQEATLVTTEKPQEKPEATERDPRQSPDGLMRHPWMLGGVMFVVFALVFALGMTFGYGWGRSTAQAAAVDAEESDGAQAALYPAFDLFWEAMDLLYRDFNGTLPTPEEATYAAIRGVVGLLDDPNTSFLTPEEAAFFRSNLDGSFEGIGARVAWDEEADTLLITEPFENQPAWKAGLRRNDLILAVDGESLVGTDVSEAVRRIRGPKGTDILLTVQRAGAAPFDVTVTRALIAIPTIATDSLGEDGKIAYVRLNAFSENSGTLVREAVRNALARDPHAMIFDLRGNSGGLLREAVKVASVFLQDEVVLLERFSDGRIETYRTEGRAVTTDLPVVVLVNEGSASASEIVAGALQDTGRATLIGTTTYGKGSVQLPHNLSNGSIMRVTIARWFSPKDRTIDGVGLTPDVIVPISDAEYDAGQDPQLDAALELLEKRMRDE